MKKQMYLIKTDDKASPLNYEVIGSEKDLYDHIALKTGKTSFTMTMNGLLFSYKVGKTVFEGILATIYEEDGKYFTKSRDKYFPLPL